MHRFTYVQADWLCPCPILPDLPQLMQQFWFFQTKILLLLSCVVFFNCANNAKSFSSVFTATLKGQARWRCPNSVEKSVLQAKSEEKFCNHKSGGLEKLCSAFCTCCAHKLPNAEVGEREGARGGREGSGGLSQANQ